jgi:HD superfamily phosphodiesterase
MSYQDASRAVEDYITAIFQLHPNQKLVYHNHEHTRKVAQHANEIALFYKLNDEQLFIITASACFHDIGYLFTGPKEHEKEAVRIMNEFIPGIISTPTLKEKIGQ